MTLLPPGVKVHLTAGYTDMRKGMDGLAVLVQEVLRCLVPGSNGSMAKIDPIASDEYGQFTT